MKAVTNKVKYMTMDQLKVVPVGTVADLLPLLTYQVLFVCMLFVLKGSSVFCIVHTGQLRSHEHHHCSIIMGSSLVPKCNNRLVHTTHPLNNCPVPTATTPSTISHFMTTSPHFLSSGVPSVHFGQGPVRALRWPCVEVAIMVGREHDFASLWQSLSSGATGLLITSGIYS